MLRLLVLCYRFCLLRTFKSNLNSLTADLFYFRKAIGSLQGKKLPASWSEPLENEWSVKPQKWISNCFVCSKIASKLFRMLSRMSRVDEFDGKYPCSELFDVIYRCFATIIQRQHGSKYRCHRKNLHILMQNFVEKVKFRSMLSSNLQQWSP